MFAARIREADEFYDAIHAPHLGDDERRVQRQAYAGLLWSKQFYHFDVYRWLAGDPEQPAPPAERWRGAVMTGPCTCSTTEQQFYFDVIRHETVRLPIEIYSMVGLVPLFAVAVVDESAIADVPIVMQTVWEALKRRPPLRALVPSFIEPGRGGTRLLCAVTGERLVPILARVLDESQFLSDFGVRSLSRRHLTHPFQFVVVGQQHEVRYLPGESDNRVFGGNSNWRGPIWFPMNFLLIQAIASFARYYPESYTVECPTGSGRHLTLEKVADELAGRLTRLFLRDAHGRRPVLGDNDHFQQDIYWRDYIPFYEYFNGDTGVGLGASHQTGWTALVALLLQHRGAVCFDRMWAERTAAAAHEPSR